MKISLPFVSLCLAALLVGCGSEREDVVLEVSLTNLVTVTETVTITNTVTLTVTNFVECVREQVVPRSSRKSAPYVVSTTSFRGSELRKFLQSAGARIIECNPGARALVEAPEKVVKEMRRGGLVTVSELSTADKLSEDLPTDGEVEVVIRPLSTIDCAAVAEAVKTAGGSLEQIVTVGSASIRARVPAQKLSILAERGDVLSITK